MRFNSLFHGAVLSVALFAANCPAVTISVDMTTLPSLQGWSWNGPFSESDIVSPNTPPGMLTIDSVGHGFPLPFGDARYVRTGDVTADPFILEWTMNLIETERDGDNTAGMVVGVNYMFEEYAVGFEADSVLDSYRIGLLSTEGGGAVRIPFDTRGFHTYRIEADPGSPTYQFFIDGSLAASVAPYIGPSLNTIAFGDSTNSAR